MERNPQYSLRAFARQLGISPAYLSLLLRGKVPLPTKLAQDLALKLELPAGRAKAWVAQVSQEESQRRGQAVPATAAPAFLELSLDRFRFFSDWWSVAVMDLSLLPGFQSNPDWVAKTLGIQKRQAKDALARLERLGVLEKDSAGVLRKTSRYVNVTVPNRSDPALRAYHKGWIKRGMEELERPETYAHREIGAATIAVSSKRIPEARKRIDAFRRELMAFLTEDSECDALYQLNTQFFPLTELKSEGESQ